MTTCAIRQPAYERLALDGPGPPLKACEALSEFFFSSPISSLSRDPAALLLFGL
jgi:hypothetical protein